MEQIGAKLMGVAECRIQGSLSEAELEQLKDYVSGQVITPNETEAELLGGVKNLLTQTKTLLITLGSKGFAIATSDSYEEYPCLKIKAVDTTAAGDTLCGGLVARFANGCDLATSAKFGSKSASIACTRKGAQPSIPYQVEVESYETLD